MNNANETKAKTIPGKNDWDFDGVVNGEVVIRGEIIGGKWRAARYCKFIRNGILARANRGRGKGE